MRVLVFGKTGQLAQSLYTRCPADFDALFINRQQADFSGTPDFDAIIASTRPDIVINAAAYTAVDRAETEEKLAHLVNAKSPGKLAHACERAGIALLHISTDYVFNGGSKGAYKENDKIDPLSVYGRSKYLGEQAVLSATPRGFVIRTAWVYSHTGQNFLTTMMRLANEYDTLSIVNDQIGNPTSSDDLADTLYILARKIYRKDMQGDLYHVTGGGRPTSWFGFALEIFKHARTHDLKVPKTITPIPSTDYPTLAKRPTNSQLDNTKLLQDFRVELPDWKESVAATVALVAAKDQENQEVET